MSGKTTKAERPRFRTEEEMRAALTAVTHGEWSVKVPPYDTTLAILQDTVDELLDLRQLRADVQAFIHDQQQKMRRKY